MAMPHACFPELSQTSVVNSGFSARLVTESVRALSIGVFLYALRKTELLKSLVLVGCLLLLGLPPLSPVLSMRHPSLPPSTSPPLPSFHPIPALYSGPVAAQ